VTISVSIHGDERVGALLAQKISRRKDLELKADGRCVIYIPGSSDDATDQVMSFLNAGIDTICTAPLDAFTRADLLEACKAGGSTFHATGGFHTVLVTRFSRAFSRISRNIRRVELTEEVDGIDTSFSDSAHQNALRVLGEAVPESDDVRFESISQDIATDSALLRYRLTTTTDDAVGHATIRFNSGSGVHPADHLTCVGVLDAIRPVHESAPGILHNELGIDYVQLDDQLSR